MVRKDCGENYLLGVSQGGRMQHLSVWVFPQTHDAAAQSHLDACQWRFDVAQKVALFETLLRL
jgi:hypothetical protein